MRIGSLLIALFYLFGGLCLARAVVALWHDEHPVWSVIFGMIAASWFTAFIQEAHQIDQPKH